MEGRFRAAVRSQTVPTMRLFFALTPDQATQDALKALYSELRGAIENDPKAEKVLRLSTPRSLHWTLRFLGEIPICELPSLFQVAAEGPCAETPPLCLTLDKPLRLGTRRQPVLCLGSPEQDSAQKLFNRLETGPLDPGLSPSGPGETPTPSHPREAEGALPRTGAETRRDHQKTLGASLQPLRLAPSHKVAARSLGLGLLDDS
jgi:2'-5' RNA ligase